MRRLAAAAVLALAPNLAPADTSSEVSADCALLLTIVAETFDHLTLVSCQDDTTAQVRAEARFTVPAAEMSSLATTLTDHYGMGPLRFVCCGYEANPRGGLPIPSDRTDRFAVENRGAYPGISLTLIADGFDAAGDIIGIGETDGLLIVEWVEV